MATWPSTLPPPLADGYQLQPTDQAIRTDMETGAPRVRRRTAARNDKLSLSWQFTDAEMAIFRAWYENDSTGAAGGAGWFTSSVKIGTGGLVSLACRFSGVYQATYNPGSSWRVTAQVEVR